MKNAERVIILTIVFSVLLFELLAQSRQKFIQNVQNYQSSVKLKHIEKNNAEIEKIITDIDTNTFNLNTYISLFNKLSLRPGVMVKYIYQDNRLDGHPCLYAIKDSTLFYSTIEKYYKNSVEEYSSAVLKQNILIDNTSAYDKKKIISDELDSIFQAGAIQTYASLAQNKLSSNVIPDNTKSGFLQYLFMNIHGERFGLHWHSNYALSSVITSKEELIKYFNKYREGIFEIRPSGFDSLMNHKPDIKIRMKKNKCMVTWYEFAPFAGYLQYIYSIERNAPFRINLEKKKLLIGVNPTMFL